ncbi:MAG: hypothetical protein DWQ05_10140 [Calditrichaeota bacterium]|nr:MAG: hypothetical protein DWQ05_10140 [Calditrichota bacterium]
MSTTEQYQPTDRISQLLFTLGNAYLDRQQYPEAYEKFDQLIDRGVTTPDILHKTAISAIGSNYITEKALEVYHKAIESNPESSALKIGLATLFAQHNIVTPFVLEVCESALRYKPANAQKIHFFLKNAYSESGHSQKVYEHEQKVIFGSDNKKAIRSYLESLWWEHKFEEAHRSLTTAYNPNNPTYQFDVERALTQAYDLLAKEKQGDNDIDRSNLEIGLKQINPANSLLDLRSYLILRSCFPDIKPSDGELDENRFEEYQFILGNISIKDAMHTSNGKAVSGMSNIFDFSRDVLNIFPLTEVSGEPYEDSNSNCVCFMQIFTHGANQVSEKIINLVEEHLVQSNISMSVRRVGVGFIVLSDDLPSLVKTITLLLHHLDDYNQKINKQYRISLLTGVWLLNFRKLKSERKKLNQFLHALHLIRIVELNITKDAGAGMLLIAGEDNEMKSIEKDLSDISMLKRGPVELLPHKSIPYFEVVWKTPLDSMQEGKSYYLGRFEIKKCLTKHQTYATYSAFDEQLSRTVLIKVLMIKESIRYLEDANARQDLFDQIRGVGRLNHPHITNLYDMGEHKNMFYYVREFVDGKKLNEIEFDAKSRENKILDIMQKLVRALAYAQHKNILHLNLKPSNIWINGAQELSITDFRIRGFAANLAENDVLYPGYWRYMAPEMFDSENNDRRSDFYSIGVIAYELLTGTHPYDCDSTNNIKGPKDLKHVVIEPLNGGIKMQSDAWQALIDSTLAYNIEDRFDSYSQIDMQLRKIQMELMANSS